MLSRKSGGGKLRFWKLAPRHGFEPRFTAPKAAVLPLDDRGVLLASSPFILPHRGPEILRPQAPGPRVRDMEVGRCTGLFFVALV